MRSSLTEIKAIEAYLAKTMPADEALLLEAKQLLDPSLALNITIQQKLTQLAKSYGRRMMRKKLVAISNELFQTSADDGFRASIFKHFNE